MQPCAGFDVRRDGELVTAYVPMHSISTGITLGRYLPAIVAPYEEYDAMLIAGFNEREWDALDYDVRVRAVAFHRVRRYMGLHENDAVARAQKRSE